MIRIGLMTLLLCLALSCDSADTQSSAWDVSTADVLASEDASDEDDRQAPRDVADGDAPRADVADGDGDGGLADEDAGFYECDCDDPKAVCAPLYCRRPDVECDETASEDECPEGSRCYGETCYCDGDQLESGDCRPRCENDDDCPSLTNCDTEAGRCDLPAKCETNLYCDVDSGERCVAVEGLPNDRCYDLSDGKENGARCEENYECASGLCYYDGRCLPRCSMNSDCRADEHCGRVGTTEGMGCLDDAPDCDCPDGHCGVGDECKGQVCYQTRDCKEGFHCLNHPKRISLRGEGECVAAETSSCSGDEIRIDDDEFEGFCSILEWCDEESGDGCPSGYKCIGNGDPPDTITYFAMCSRVLDGG